MTHLEDSMDQVKMWGT